MKRFLFTCLVAAPLSLGACMVSGTGTMGYSATGGAVVYQEPPQDQVEQVEVRPGYVWIKGRWDWRNNQWAWIGGRWERERTGWSWEAGRWDRRSNQWHWIEGHWVQGGGTVVVGGGQPGGSDVVVHSDDGYGNQSTTVVNQTHSTVSVTDTHGGGTVTVSGTYPTAAPPAARVENYGAPRAGFIWMSGHWDWRNGQWVWLDGRWERERARQVWIGGKWELQGNYYVWIEGHWGNR